MLYATADLHGQLPPVPEDCTTLLIVGDICPDFRPLRDPALQSAWLDNEFRVWLTRLTVVRGIKVVAIWGNHDFVGEHSGLVPDLPWTLLQDSEVTVNGLRIYGTPWVPGLPYWAFFANERTLLARSEAIPEGLDVLMTHGPPYGVADLVPYNPKYAKKYGVPPEGQHVGDKYLNSAIERAQPTLTLCGHIHEARGSFMLKGRHPIQNVAAVDAAYQLYDKPIVRL